MQTQTCLFCGNIVQLVHVHGHYQCPVCKTNALPCCDGDNCDTNILLKQQVKDPLPERDLSHKHQIINPKPS